MQPTLTTTTHYGKTHLFYRCFQPPYIVFLAQRITHLPTTQTYPLDRIVYFYSSLLFFFLPVNFSCSLPHHLEILGPTVG